MKLVPVYPDVEPGLELWMPDTEASRECWGDWELGRYLSIVSALEPGDSLWEVGAEHGVMAALYATKLGGSSLTLIEPSPEMWRDIRAVWEANLFDQPARCLPALCGTVDSEDWALALTSFAMPAVAYAPGGEAPVGSYRYLFEANHRAEVPIVRLDSLLGCCPTPAGVSIDVEGAELQVLLGASQLLAEARPVVWVSIHPDLMARDFGDRPEQVHELMDAAGYRADHLGTDHEEHWAFWPR